MIRLPRGPPHVVGVLDVGGVRLSDRVPSHEVGRAPPADGRGRIDDRIALVRRPLEPVRRVVEVAHHRRRRVLGPVEMLVALRRVLLVGVLERRRHGVRRQDVVLFRPLELHQSQRRPFPVDAVFGRREALHGFVVAEDLDAPRPTGLPLRVDTQVRAGVPHLEQPLVIIVEDLAAREAVALPGSLGPEDRVVVDLHRGVHALLRVGHALDDVVVEE